MNTAVGVAAAAAAAAVLSHALHPFAHLALAFLTHAFGLQTTPLGTSWQWGHPRRLVRRLFVRTLFDSSPSFCRTTLQNWLPGCAPALPHASAPNRCSTHLLLLFPLFPC